MRRLVPVLFLAACTAPAAEPPGQNPAASVLAFEADAGICEDCACLAVECGPDAAPPPCERCDPAADAGTCATGCCGKLRDVNGEVLRDPGGEIRYGCVEATCLSDDECLPGLICSPGEGCDENRCLCPDGLPPWEEDAEFPCCQERNLNGVCCESGLVDGESGLCICEDPLMVDLGEGCTCPSDMEHDEENGGCRCLADGAEVEPYSGVCLCPEGTWLHHDEYVGTVWCAGDDDPPPDCWDESAVFNPLTGLCECKPGTTLQNLPGYATPFCDVPRDAGPGPDAPGPQDAGPKDAGADPTPDAAVITIPDAGVPPIQDAAVGDRPITRVGSW